MSIPSLIRTRSGEYVDFLDPDPATIRLCDIAYGLAHTNRFAGQFPRRYTVAEHVMFCAEIARTLIETETGSELPTGVKSKPLLATLLHDAAEAYLCDIPSPIKQHLPEYTVMEERLQAAIEEKYGTYNYLAFLQDTDVTTIMEWADRVALVLEFDEFRKPDEAVPGIWLCSRMEEMLAACRSAGLAPPDHSHKPSGMLAALLLGQIQRHLEQPLPDWELSSGEVRP